MVCCFSLFQDQASGRLVYRSGGMRFRTWEQDSGPYGRVAGKMAGKMAGAGGTEAKEHACRLGRLIYLLSI